VPVAGGDGPPLPCAPAFGVVVGVEDVAFAVEEDGHHGRVAQEPFGCLLGESPAVTTQDELVEVVDVSQAGEGAQVDVDVDPHPGPGSGAAPCSSAPAPFGPAEPATHRLQSLQRVGEVDRLAVAARIVGGGEGFVEGVGGGPPVEGVGGGDVLPLRQVVIVGGCTPAGVVGVECGAAEVVEGVSSPLTQAAPVRRIPRVGVVGPGVDGRGDVQERGGGQVGVDLAATEEPLGHRHRVTGDVSDGAFLVDQVAPVVQGGGPVLRRRALPVQSEECVQGLGEPRFALVGDHPAERLGPGQGQLAGEHSRSQRRVPVAQPGDPLQAMRFAFGAVRVGQQPPLGRRGPSRDPGRGGPQAKEGGDEVTLG